ncbi:hypothetical protein LJB96_00190 [Methanobrevibacter sp. OttesenSCG-928-K11]|nr:hypothetical protein [Methanobrevibacter sp. OttesenSCG-928-K11]
MKKYLLAIFIIFSVVFVSGCISDDNSSNSGDIQTVSKNGVILKYPSTWVLSDSKSNNSLVSVSESSSIDSSKIGQVNVNVEKKELTTSLDSFINQTYTSMQKEGLIELISQGEVSYGGNTYIEVIYKSDINGTVKQHKALWTEKDGNAIVILCSAPENKFDSNLKVFNFIIENIQFT